MMDAKLAMARLETDPERGWRAENSAIADGDPTFGRTLFEAKTLSGKLTISRELAADRMNVGAMIENAFAQSMAVELDRAAIFGDGTGNSPRGVWHTSGINAVSMGANGAALTSYDPLLDAILALKNQNAADPTAMIYAPRTEIALAKPKNADLEPLGCFRSTSARSRGRSGQCGGTSMRGSPLDIVTYSSDNTLKPWGETMRFVALDVETANADMASICSIGVVTFDSGQMVDEWYSLVDPRDYFDDINVSIHGISERDVAGAPDYATLSHDLAARLSGAVVVTHTHFDRVALSQATVRHGANPLGCTWLDSARAARRAWEECASSGYGLANVCEMIGYRFKHHNALEDAKAAGHVMLAAMERSGLGLEDWLARATQPVSPGAAVIRREGNPDGPLAGEVLVFTGALEIPRREAADLAAAAGCEVGSGVTKKTTLLVVGDIDVTRTAGHEKSGKHRKAEELIAMGAPIRIIRESDFRQLV